MLEGLLYLVFLLLLLVLFLILPFIFLVLLGSETGTQLESVTSYVPVSSQLRPRFQSVPVSSPMAKAFPPGRSTGSACR